MPGDAKIWPSIDKQRRKLRSKCPTSADFLRWSAEQVGLPVVFAERLREAADELDAAKEA